MCSFAENLFLFNVYHKSYVEMTEEGTVAGAGTAEPVAMGKRRQIISLLNFHRIFYN